MANLTFYYGTMSSGKTLALLMGAYNLEKINKSVLVLKSSVDTKANECIQTRIGLERKVDLLVAPNESLTKYFDIWKSEGISHIFVDEAQFLSELQVKELWYFSKKYNIPVECYGLKAQYDLKLFEGSQTLLELADSIQELPTPAICTGCGAKAVVNARFLDNKIELPGGESIIIDGSNKYEYRPLCGDCYLEEIEKVGGSFIEIPKQKIKSKKKDS